MLFDSMIALGSCRDEEVNALSLCMEPIEF